MTEGDRMATTTGMAARTMRGVKLPGGVPVFTRAWAMGSAERLLASHGLHPTDAVVLDEAEREPVTVWVR
mgnify:CR=1 FL=1